MDRVFLEEIRYALGPRHNGSAISCDADDKCPAITFAT